MNIKTLIAATSLALLPQVAGADWIIPAAGTGSGANNSRWETEVTLHNTSSQVLSPVLTFHDASGTVGSAVFVVQPRSTVSIQDVVRQAFQREQATGAIEVRLPGAPSSRLAVTSRTFNRSAEGQFGQDIPAVEISDAAWAGEVVVIPAPSSAANFRFNFGVYAVQRTTVRWELLRANGNVAATREVEYAAGTQFQYNNGVATFFNGSAQDNDVVHAVVMSGQAIFYGSQIHAFTNDPNYVPGIRTRTDSRLSFGIDEDENGTVDVTDGDRDGILDRAIDAGTIGFPSYFRIVVTGESGPVTLQILESTADARIIDSNGTVQLVAGGNLRNTSGVLRVRALTSDGRSEVLTIPIRFV